MFSDKAPISTTTSNVVRNLGDGVAVCPLKAIVAISGDSTAGQITATLQTSVDEAFTTPIPVATYVATWEDPVVGGPIPYSANKGYFRMVFATDTAFAGGTLTPTITAALVYDMDIEGQLETYGEKPQP